MRHLIFLLFCVPALFAAEDWGPVQFLAGHWTGEGGGQPGQGTGAFSFEPDLQGKVLVRRSFAEYPAANGRPAYRHEDLTIVYRDGETRRLRADYFDNEEHAIHYEVTPVEGGAVFASERYRLTYTSMGPDRLKLRFEIAQPGKGFVTYIESTARRD